MLRSVCLLALGRRLEAHLELNEWARKSSAPLQARVLLALLEWFAGDRHSAMAALLRNMKQLEDPRSLTALTLIAAAEGRRDLASCWAVRLRNLCAWSGSLSDVNLILRSIGFETLARSELVPGQSHIDALATELLANEAVVPALVQSMCLRTPRLQDNANRTPADNRSSAALLMKAIEKALPDLEDGAAGYEALAQLSIAIDDRPTALEWANRGLASYPLSANLARLARELADQPDDSEVGEDAVLATIGAVRRERAA